MLLFGALGCGESRKRLFNPLSQFSRLGVLVSSSTLFLMCLTIVQFITSVQCTCMFMDLHVLLSGLPFFPSYLYVN